MVKVLADDKEFEMEVDTGASVSIISNKTFKELWKGSRKLKESTVVLRSYANQIIKVLGELDVTVVYGDQKKSLSLLVVAGKGPSLLGRDWLRQIRLNWNELYRIDGRPTPTLNQILDKHREVFKDELGLVKGVAVKIHVEPDVKPRFFRPRPVPLALKSKLEDELNRLLKEGIIQPVQFSDWATPVVPVVKDDGSLRLCGDYRVTVNRCAKLEEYPLPHIEDLFAALAGGKAFTKLDLANAYLQLPLDEKSKEYTTINTPKGLFQYNRLPFGISSAPAIFQRTIESLLQGLPHVIAYIDDMLVTGRTEADHLRNLDEVLARLEAAGMRLKASKCKFLQAEVQYLGHCITSEGVFPTEEKVRAVQDAPAPQNVQQLRSFLGSINYYGKFLPNLSTRLAPLHDLLTKGKRWSWTKMHQDAFQGAKDLLTSSRVLIHFDSSKEVLLSCDASPYGVGAVLSHRFEDGSEHPVAFASRSLSSAEKNYSQLDKEGLAIIFGVKKFHNYLQGREFTIITDHKPLKHLFGEDQPISPLVSARLQRWVLILGAYQYKIQYKAGKDNAID